MLKNLYLQETVHVLAVQGKNANTVTENEIADYHRKIAAPPGAVFLMGVMEMLEYQTCPDCGSTNLIHESGCVVCQDCGWSPCR
jgi:uncharacterized Zn finger protein (UPF0148 family)